MYKYQSYAESGMFRNIFSSVTSPVEEEVICYFVFYILYCVLHVGLSYYKYGRRKGLCDVTELLMFQFLYPPKNFGKPRGFLMFSGGIEREKWHETD